MAQKLHIHTLLRSHGLRRLLPYVRRNSTRLGLGMLCALAATTFTYLTVRIFGMFTDAATGVHFDPGLIQRLGDQIRHGQRDPATIQQLLDVVAKAIPDQHAINRDAYLLSLVFFLKGICWYGQSYFVSSASQKALLRLRNDVYSHLQRMGLSFFDRRKTGQLMATVTADIPQIQTAVGQNIIDAVNSPFTIIAGITYVVWLNWRLALLSAAIIPFMSLLIGAARRRMGRATKQMQIALADISELMEETLACVRVVRACVTEEAETQRFIANSQNSYRAYMRGVRIMSSLRPMVELIGSLGITLAIWVGEKQIASDPQHFTLGDLLQFVGAVHYISQAFGGLGNLSLGFQQANVAAERVFALLDEAPDVQDAPDAPDLGPVQGSLQFLDVEFAYDESPVLKGISFSVSPGEALAIVGLSGAGKSTIANLIPRFYDVTGGSIRIDQTDIRSVTTASLRRQIGIVLLKIEDGILLHLLLDPLLERQDGQLQNLHGLDHPRRQHLFLLHPQVLTE